MFGPELQLMTSYGIRFASKLVPNTTCDCSNAVRENMDVHSRSSFFKHVPRSNYRDSILPALLQ